MTFLTSVCVLTPRPSVSLSCDSLGVDRSLFGIVAKDLAKHVVIRMAHGRQHRHEGQVGAKGTRKKGKGKGKGKGASVRGRASRKKKAGVKKTRATHSIQNPSTTRSASDSVGEPT
jgi:hypothetical protein